VWDGGVCGEGAGDEGGEEKESDMTTDEKLAKAMDLLERAHDRFADDESAPDARWFRDYFGLTGDHAVLTEDGWSLGSEKADLVSMGVEILDEVNAPPAAA